MWKIALCFITCCRLVLTVSISTINNAVFDPNDVSYRLNILSGIQSLDSCICQCSTNLNCSIINYYGLNQTCILFSAQLSQGSLRVVPTSKIITLVIFGNTNSTNITSTYTSTSISTTTANMSCIPSTNYILSYTTSPLSYTQQIYNFTAQYSGFATLEFGFKAKNPAFTWHLDDVSIIDTSALNIEMLVNGNFENGTLIGWQILCSSNNCGGTGSSIVQTTCHTDSFCYEGTCAGNYDYLRQSFSITIGHIYTLSFWVYTDGHSDQAAYVNIS
ncbi:unnamed protein product [Adineta steineri]|uniref:Apple domain-containing protein n=2 Tax=Adineta steineri TaxID=433720 RepID=A0A814INU7_9BILA|nr:unnamed protein product [Adineta steineri]